jgi:hypothetical protein
MNAADTSASSAIADWTPLTVVCRSCTTAEIETFISDVSTTSTNIAIANRIASRRSPELPSDAPVLPARSGTPVLAPSVSGDTPASRLCDRLRGWAPGDHRFSIRSLVCSDLLTRPRIARSAGRNLSLA